MNYKKLAEKAFIKKLITQTYPSGVVSIVSDTFDFWQVVTEILPELKDDIMNREKNALGLAKVVIRPDSGDPVHILTGYDWEDIEDLNYLGFSEMYKLPEVVRKDGRYFDISAMFNGFTGAKEYSEAEVKGAVECLYDTFGGEVTEEGYKMLHERIGLIYGDSITRERCIQILQRLADKGFAASNVVFGVGSFTYQYNTRDTLGWAIKATYGEVNGEGRFLFKDPATDSGTKKSAKGYMSVHYGGVGGRMFMVDEQEFRPIPAVKDLLQPVFRDGKLLVEYTLSDIRKRLWGDT